MAIFIVTTGNDVVDPDDGLLSLREAVAQAGTSPGPDTIVFGPGFGIVTLQTALEIGDAAGLSIIGDRDNDGLSDIIVFGTGGHHATILEGAKVTLVGLDLVSGAASGKSGANGANGADGQQGVLDPAAPGQGHPGTDGTGGGNGINGENVAGSIDNFGDLTLIRVGFGGNGAAGGAGGNGGGGGFGGLGTAGQNGADGISAMDELDDPTQKDGKAGLRGGDGGNGGTGGDGGRGGDAAGAILNRDSGVLTLVDVAFGGRLTSGTIAGKNVANAGNGGNGGFGGGGGNGGAGGEGGDAGSDGRLLSFGDYLIPPNTSIPLQWGLTLFGEAGGGGRGGDGGDRGIGGRNGDGGNAAGAILNLGSITADAVVALGAAHDAVAGAAGTLAGFGSAMAGPGGPGGLDGRAFRDAAVFLHNGQSDKGYLETLLGLAPAGYPIAVSGTPSQNALDLLEGKDIWDPAPLPRDPGPAGVTGLGGSPVQAGAAGTAGEGLLNAGSGAGAVATGGSLVYVHNIGATLDGEGNPQLSFHIARIGAVATAAEIGWRLVGVGDNPARAGDFTGAALSGTVTLEAFPSGNLDRTVNVARVDLPIAVDSLASSLKTYAIQILDPSTGIVLGTKRAEGAFDPKGIMAGTEGTEGDDILIGTSLADVLDGKDGNDKLYGLEGNDVLIGGSGNDVLDGGSGTDFLLGGPGDDTYHVDSPFDVVDEGFLFPDLGGGGFDTIISSASLFWDIYNVGERLIISEAALAHDISAIVGGLFGKEIIGNSGNNIIFSVGGSNVVRPGDGVDFISFGLFGLDQATFGGVNTLVVEKSGSGAMSWDILYDFTPGKDRIDISDFGFASFDPSGGMGFDDGAGNSFFVLGGTEILFVVGRTIAELGEGDFIV